MFLLRYEIVMFIFAQSLSRSVAQSLSRQVGRFSPHLETWSQF